MMKMRYLFGNAKWCWLMLVSLMVATSSQATGITKAAQAMNCQPDSLENNYQGTCPYASELYTSDPTFKKDMESALQNAGFAGLLGPDGILNGPENALEPVTAGDQAWLMGYACEKGNCGDNYLRFLYQPSEHRILGFYYNGKEHWIGGPRAVEAKLLRGNADTLSQETPPAAAISPDGPPANTIWEFTGNTGKTLWQACGGKSNSCSIIANTKYYVAVLNRKSAQECAFGDFYIAARDTSSWQQYETGTCSPDAYIRKGTINNGQYLSVDIGVNGVLVQQYPIGYWSMQKEFSGKRRPSWSKVKEKQQ
jgi:hypothetical protein